MSSEKRARILEAAAREFAANGYDGASLNHILDEAGISKGAAYYYFDDKADLFTTTVMHYFHELAGGSLSDPSRFTAANFWEGVAAVYRQQFTTYAERPWVFGVVKAGGALSPESLGEGPLAAMLRDIQLLLAQFLQRGRELGVVRSDLPEDLLLSLVMAVDAAHDRWLYANWSQLSAADLEQAAVRIGDTLHRLLSPGDGAAGGEMSGGETA